MKNLMYLILSSFLAIALTACPGGETSDPNKIASVNITGVNTLEVGQGANFTAQALNSSNTPVATTFTWSSTDPNILDIEPSTGKVTAKKTGSASIEAKASDANQTKASSSLNVTMTLRINAQAFGDEPVTIFISNSDGSVAQSKTVTGGSGYQKLEFSGVSSDALLTAAYKYVAADYNGGTTLQSVVHYRLNSYLASYVKQNAAFYFDNDAYLGNLTAQVAKPSILEVTKAGGTGYHWCCTYDFGISTSLTLNDGLYRSDLQTDGKYSPVLFAYDTNSHLKAYAPFLDQIYDANNRDKNFGVAAPDWKTDLSTTSFTVSNAPANTYLVYCSSVGGLRKGIPINPTSMPCEGNSNGTTLTTGSREYVPSLYDQFTYSTGFGMCCTNKPGDPFTYNHLNKRVSSIPATIALNAVTDFLPFIENLAVTNPATGRPSYQWNAIANTSGVQNVNVHIFDRDAVANFDYRWYVFQLPNTTTSFNFPQIPDSILDFAPKEGNAGRKYRASVWYESRSSDGLVFQETTSQVNFDPTAVKSRGLTERLTTLETPEPNAIHLKQ